MLLSVGCLYLFFFFIVIIVHHLGRGSTKTSFVITSMIIIGDTFVLVFVVLALQVERLGEPHPGHTDESNDDQDSLKRTLFEWNTMSILTSSSNFTAYLAREELFFGIDLARRQEHVDQHVEEIGRRIVDMMAITVKFPPVDTPLVHDTEDKITKDGFHEQNLRDEFQPNNDLLSKVDMVEHIQTDSKGHLQQQRERIQSDLCFL